MTKSYIFMAPLAAVAFAYGAMGTASAAVDSSEADALVGQFTANGYVTKLSPVAQALGAAPPSFDEWNRVPSYKSNLSIVYDTQPGWQPTLISNISLITDHAAGSGIGVDSFGSEGDTRIDGASIALTVLAPPNEPISVEPPLTITAKGLRASANYSVVVPQSAKVNGTASFTKLTISGPLVGGQVLTYEGTPPKDFVLYSSPEVKITLNQHMEEAIITCVFPGGCKVIPTAFEVDAVAVTLTNADLYGKKISGGFSLGRAQAH